MRRRWIAVARGDEQADLLLHGGEVLSVFTGEVFRADVAIADGYVVGVGEYDAARERIDVSGRIVIPGFIDGHCHIESSKLNVDEFARAIVPLGTTGAVVDPHELANVLGILGIEFVLEASEHLPLRVFVMVPSCVPASRFESPAGALYATDLAELLRHDRVLGIAEMMNYPAAIAGDPDVLAKMTMSPSPHVDGHAPGVSGRALNAYIVSGPGSDHECTTLAEAMEKRRLGMWVMIREASMIRNLVDLLPMLREYGTENCMFVTDDREAQTLLDEGHMNSMVRTAVAHGLDAGDAIKLASLNVARWHGLAHLGAVAPGYAADLQVVPNLVSFMPEIVLQGGKVVAANGVALPFQSPSIPPDVTGSVRIGAVADDALRVAHRGETTIRVVGLIPDQVVTRAEVIEPLVRDGEIVADPGRDLAKLAVIERHHASGVVGVGFVRGFGLREGAFAATVAHDAHNVIVTGMNDADMLLAARRLEEIGGGLVVVRAGQVRGELPLEIAGLMSTRDARTVVDAIAGLEASLREMGVTLATPFMYLGFLALSVIPEMRVTDQGIVDVRSFEIVPLGAS
jgi:adenine deaminase